MCDVGHAVAYYGQSKDSIQEEHLKNRKIWQHRRPDEHWGILRVGTATPPCPREYLPTLSLIHI